MAIHEFDNNMLPDSAFISAEIKHLVKGNKGRMLDGRRTPGYIEDYFPTTAMFRWRITAFEDNGNCWDLPAESIIQFQLTPDSATLSVDTVAEIKNRIKHFSQIIDIHSPLQHEGLNASQAAATSWLSAHADKKHLTSSIDLSSRHGSKYAASLLSSYMQQLGFLHLEDRTAQEIVLNPNSEWMKHIRIALAELGVVPYHGTIIRDEMLLALSGGLDQLKNYLFARLGFVRALFSMLGMKEIIVYRGMASEGEWLINYQKSLTSWTFSQEVAFAFADFAADHSFKNGYIFKRTLPISSVFMTYIETTAMNQQYKEAEAILFYNQQNGIW